MDNKRVRRLQIGTALAVMLAGGSIAAWALYQIEQAPLLMENRLSEVKNQLEALPPPSLLQDTASVRPERNATPKPAVLYPIRPKLGDPVGILFIPKIKQEYPIIHGTEKEQLKEGVGHFARSVLPGEPNNSVLSGHRDTVFTELGKLEIGDLLTVQTSAGIFNYKITNIRIVDKDDKSVIVPTDRPTLTLTTCYPFDFIGDAPERYILSADLVDAA